MLSIDNMEPGTEELKSKVVVAFLIQTHLVQSTVRWARTVSIKYSRSNH